MSLQYGLRLLFATVILSVFKQHPDWLVKDSSGQPLRSDKVTFAGWRLAPWYVLDGTNPAVQRHLTNVFKTMSQKWGCTYFKLDANFWGALPGGVYNDKNATRVSAYRSGMKAVLKGAGNSFILGCNHPLWPSLGLINASRSSNDIDRNWGTFLSTGKENLMRAWQNGNYGGTILIAFYSAVHFPKMNLCIMLRFFFPQAE